MGPPGGLSGSNLTSEDGSLTAIFRDLFYYFETFLSDILVELNVLHSNSSSSNRQCHPHYVEKQNPDPNININILVMKMYRCLPILWFSKDDKVTDTEEIVCMPMYSDRNFLLCPLYRDRAQSPTRPGGENNLSLCIDFVLCEGVSLSLLFASKQLKYI